MANKVVINKFDWGSTHILVREKLSQGSTKDEQYKIIEQDLIVMKLPHINALISKSKVLNEK